LEQLRYDTLSLNDLVRFAQTNLGISVGRSTISRVLNEFGMTSYTLPKKPKLTSAQRKDRVSWCTGHLDWSIDDWSKVIFSDESSFELINRHNKIYIRRYRYDQHRLEKSQPRTHKGGGLGMWGCLTNHGVGNLVFYQGSIDSSKYIELLDSNLSSAFNRFPVSDRTGAILQQDNAKIHTSKKTLTYMKNKRIKLLSWPANSTRCLPLYIHKKNRCVTLLLAYERMIEFKTDEGVL